MMIVMVVMSDRSNLKRDYHFDSSFYLKRILFVVAIGSSPSPPITKTNIYSRLLLSWSIHLSPSRNLLGFHGLCNAHASFCNPQRLQPIMILIPYQPRKSILPCVRQPALPSYTGLQRRYGIIYRNNQVQNTVV